MKLAIAHLAQHSLLAGSLTLLSTNLLHAQDISHAKLATHSSETIPYQTASLSATTPSPAPLDPNLPRTLKEAGLNPQTLLPTGSLHPPNPSSPHSPTSSQVSQTPTTEVTSYQPIAAQIGGSFTSGPGTGYDSSYFGLEGFVPLVQTPGKSIAYLQGRFTLDTADGNPGGNLILGYRNFNPKASIILGGYVGLDLRDTGRETFSQLGMGIEALAPGWEFRLNGYLPVGDRRRQVSETNFDTTLGTAGQLTAARFQGNSLLLDLSGSQQQRTTTRNYEVSLAGLDAEAGVTLWRWSPVGTLKSYLGLYYYSGSSVSGFVGIRGRLEARISENLRAGVSVQSDREFGTRAVFSLGFRFPGVGSSSDSPQQAAWARVGESVFRQTNVAVTQRATTDVTIVGATPATTVVALNPTTNQPWVFQHVILGSAKGNGTFENPFGTVANGLAATQTDGNSIVYVQAGTNPTIPTFTIPDNVQVLSTGSLQQLSTVQAGMVQLPLSGAGTLPTVTDTIKMGNNTVLSGFAVTPPSGSTAILANGVQNVTIRDNQAQTSGTNIPAVRLQNITGTATVSNNILTTAGNSSSYPVEASGIEVDLDNTTLANLRLTNNQITITGNATDAISIFPINNGAITALTIAGNTLTIKGDLSYGIYLNPQTNGRLSAVTLSGNTITTTGLDSDGIVVSPNSNSAIAEIDISNNTITTRGNSADGIKIGTGFNGPISKVNVSNNTITTPGASANGIYLNINQPAATPLQATITNNTLNQIGRRGILFQTRGNTQATATVANNTVSQATDVGLNLQAFDSSVFRAVVDRNQVFNTVSSGGAQIGMEIFSANLAQMFASVTNNQVSQGSAFVSPNQVEYKFNTSSGGNKLCVQVLNNSASNSGYFFTNSAGNTLQLEPFTGNVGTRQTDSGTITDVATGTCGF